MLKQSNGTISRYRFSQFCVLCHTFIYVVLLLTTLFHSAIVDIRLLVEQKDEKKCASFLNNHNVSNSVLFDFDIKEMAKGKGDILAKYEINHIK